MSDSIKHRDGKLLYKDGKLCLDCCGGIPCPNPCIHVGIYTIVRGGCVWMRSGGYVVNKWSDPGVCSKKSIGYPAPNDIWYSTDNCTAYASGSEQDPCGEDDSGNTVGENFKNLRTINSQDPCCQGTPPCQNPCIYKATFQVKKSVGGGCRWIKTNSQRYNKYTDDTCSTPNMDYPEPNKIEPGGFACTQYVTGAEQNPCGGDDTTGKESLLNQDVLSASHQCCGTGTDPCQNSCIWVATYTVTKKAGDVCEWERTNVGKYIRWDDDICSIENGAWAAAAEKAGGDPEYSNNRCTATIYGNIQTPCGEDDTSGKGGDLDQDSTSGSSACCQGGPPPPEKCKRLCTYVYNENCEWVYESSRIITESGADWDSYPANSIQSIEGKPCSKIVVGGEQDPCTNAQDCNQSAYDVKEEFGCNYAQTEPFVEDEKTPDVITGSAGATSANYTINDDGTHSEDGIGTGGHVVLSKQIRACGKKGVRITVYFSGDITATTYREDAGPLNKNAVVGCAAWVYRGQVYVGADTIVQNKDDGFIPAFYGSTSISVSKSGTVSIDVPCACNGPVVLIVEMYGYSSLWKSSGSLQCAVSWSQLP